MSGIEILKIVSIISVGIVASCSALGASFGDAKVAASAVEGVARQPEARGSILSTMLIGIGLVEATPIIGIVIALILLYANPLLG
jgi:F-type H+-transporting ATPase subunit c